MKLERSGFLKKAALFFLTAIFLCLYLSTIEANNAPDSVSKTLKKEIEIGKKTAIEIEKNIPRVLDPNKEAHLALIANRLIPFLERELDYNVRILEMKETNAFSLPGGTTYITTGMLSFLKSDAEIAAILAHEFVHADKAHVIIQNKKSNKLNLITLLGILVATQGVGAPAMLVSSAVQTAIMNSYSIEMEKEADAIGIDILFKAGFSPTAMLTTMERLKVERMKRAYVDPGIYQTHPDDKERVEAALKYMKDKGIAVNRRDVVKKLKPEVELISGDIFLNIDGITLFSIKESKESMLLIRELAEKLNKYLELELAPYDIQVGTFNGEEALLIKGNIIIKESESIPGTPNFLTLREKINDIINEARRENPISNYFQ